MAGYIPQNEPHLTIGELDEVIKIPRGLAAWFQHSRQLPIAKGDTLSVSIAAASIVAKVTRDRLMERYNEYYPQFGFSQHKGYPTRAHKEAIRKFGYCPIHRRTFKGVKEFVNINVSTHNPA